MNSKSILTICLTSTCVAGAFFLVVACATQEPEPVTAPPPPPPALAKAAAATATEPGAARTAQPEAPQIKPPLVVKDDGIRAPESILYDADQDLYFVSNCNGKPTDKDNNGFISKVGADGKVMEAKFIEGGQKGVTLDAPKGMAIVGDTLYVTDITWVRMFDRKTGTNKGKLAVPGATFLNDITADADGKLYLTDTGWKQGEKSFEPTGTDAIIEIDPKIVVPKKLVADAKLGNPNGIVATQDGVWVVTATGQMYLVKGDKQEQITKLPSGGLDGIVALDDGTFLVSSWEASAVFHGKPGGTFTRLIEGTTSPADIGYDSKRHRLLMPQMTENTLLLYELPKGSTPTSIATPNPQAETAQPAVEKSSATKRETAQPAVEKSSAAKRETAQPVVETQPATKAASPAAPGTPAAKPAAKK